ncbi:hypothetical protein I3760_10G002100 [Carya illinoinensis]|nr:hypothetical protein I3760_10G002100 [Carya illinoinensis]
MANNKKKTTNSPKLEQIDNLPYYYSQKPRSSQPKRRSDFSSFFYSAPLYNSGSLPGSSCGEVGLSNVTMNSLNDRNAEGEQLPEHPLVQCCKFQDKELRFSSDFSETLTVEVETVAQNELFDTLSERSVECTPSHATETNGFCITPGSVVWARTASHMWWPAKITDRRYNSADTRNQDTGGRVLVEFYGSNDIAWLDPTRDLSQLEDCFEERSCNPMEDFQDALKQALQGKECLSSCGELFKSPDDLNDSDQQYHSSQDDFLERGRGKRERKRKLHFDEVTFPLMSAKKVRRFRIMRYLGLSAPIGSPFFIN